MSGKNKKIEMTVARECCLHGAGEQLLEKLRSELTIDNPKYKAAKKYSRWVGKKLKPKLYFYKEDEEEFCFPRGFANEFMRICDRMDFVRPQLIDKRRLLDEKEIVFTGTLRPYQQEAVESVVNRSFGVLEAATGSGKTVMALAVIAARRQPTLVLVHSKELMHQWRERIQEFLGIEPGQAGDGTFHIRPLTVAIVNTARKRIEELVPAFGQLIVDECHRVPASLFTDVVSGFDCHYMLGLSATAFRREDDMTKLIYLYMGDPLFRVDTEALAQSGAVIRPAFTQHETSFQYGFRGEYARLIKALAADATRNEQIAGDIENVLREKSTGTVLVVSDRVAHCEELQRLLQQRKIECTLLTGQMSTEQRAQVVEAAQAGTLQVLIATVQLIGEGFDCADLSTLVLATPIKFEGRLLQVVGRIMRPAKGKKALVIDYNDSLVPVLRRSAEARAQLFARWQ